MFSSLHWFLSSSEGFLSLTDFQPFCRRFFLAHFHFFHFDADYADAISFRYAFLLFRGCHFLAFSLRKEAEVMAALSRYISRSFIIFLRFFSLLHFRYWSLRFFDSISSPCCRHFHYWLRYLRHLRRHFRCQRHFTILIDYFAACALPSAIYAILSGCSLPPPLSFCRLATSW